MTKTSSPLFVDAHVVYFRQRLLFPLLLGSPFERSVVLALCPYFSS